MMANTPKPEPPTATLSSTTAARVVHLSGARPLTGCAPSQKKLNVWRCTISSNCGSGSATSRAATLESPGLWVYDSLFCPVSATICFLRAGFDEPDRKIDGPDDPAGEAGPAHHDGGRLC